MRIELPRAKSGGKLPRLIVRVLLLMILLGSLFMAGGLFGAMSYRVGVRPNNAVSLTKNWFQDQFLAARAVATAPDAKRLQLDIGFAEFEKIRAKREEALEIGLLFSSDDDLVPATLTFEDEVYPVRIRLKGDAIDHIVTDKWSYRIELQGENRAGGMRRFSIQQPRTRHFTMEQAFLETLRYENILAPRYDFVDVFVNGESLGHFAIEEFMGKELLESQNRRVGIIFGFEEEFFWRHVRQEPTSLLGVGLIKDSYLGTNAYINLFDEGRINKKPELLEQARVAIDNIRAFQEGLVTGSEIFDVERMGTFLALSELWQVRHSLVANNLRFYYNPVSGKIEPIGFDAQPEPTLIETVFGFAPSEQQPLIARLLDEPEIATAYMRELVRFVEPSYLVELRAAIGPKIDRSFEILRKEYPEIGSPWPVVQGRQVLLRKIINPGLAGVAYGQVGSGLPGDDASLELQVANILATAIEITGVRISPTTPAVSDSSLAGPASPSTLAIQPGKILANRRSLEDALTFETVSVTLDSGLADAVRLGASIELLGHILGQERERVIPVTLLSGSSVGPLSNMQEVTVDEALILHPFLRRGSGPKSLAVIPGVWNVTGDLVLPDDYQLSIPAATTLRFESGRGLIGSGPLVFVGTVGEPVVLEPQAESWAGVLVQRSGASSSWRHTIVRNTGGFPITGRAITGGVTFNESSLILRDVLFEGSMAEDALNVILGSIDFANVHFSGTASDAFDGDAVTGRIAAAGFVNIAGDGVDFSASDVSGTNLTFFGIGDKAVSAGEGSTVRLSNLTIDTSNIGVASKDMSIVEIVGAQFRNIGSYSLASYQKKSEYGPASLSASNITMSPGSRGMLAENGSLLIVNGSEVETQTVDIAQLYEAGILGN